MSAIKFKVHTSELDRAKRQLAMHSRRSIPEIVNRTGTFIFNRASQIVPAVSSATISSELQESKGLELVKLKNGRFSRNKKNVRSFFGGSSEPPLLALIIQARAGNRGKSSPWKGVSRAEGAQKMLAAMRKVFGARQKSRAFFKAAFGTARDIFRRSVTNKKDLPASTVIRLSRDENRIAKVSPAREGWKSSAQFEIISAKHDIGGAIYQHAEPALQKAIDEEAEKTFKRAAEMEFQEAAKLAGVRTV